MKTRLVIGILAICLIGELLLMDGADPAEAASSSAIQPVKVAFIADTGYSANFASVLRLIKREHAAFILHQGDFDYNTDPAGFFSKINRQMGKRYPYFASVGNHDAPAWPGDCTNPAGCYTPYLSARMALLGVTPDDPNLDDEMVSFTYRGIKIVSVGQEPDLGDTTYAPYIDSQFHNDPTPWKICTWHKNQSAMQVGSKTDEMGWAVYQTCMNYGAIIATGHEHSYERTRTLVDFQNQTVDPVWSSPGVLRLAPGKTFAFVSGLGGNSVRPQLRCLPTAFPYGCNGEWASIYTSDQGAKPGALFIIFNYGKDPTRAHGYFKNISGKIVDSFDVINTAPADLLTNGSFEANKNRDITPDSWNRGYRSPDGWDCTVAYGGKCSVRLAGTGKATKAITQKIGVSGGAHYQFNLSFWYRGDNVPGPADLNAVQVRITYTNKTSQDFWVTVPAGTQDWTEYTLSFAARSPFKGVSVIAHYPLLGGTVWYDQMKLTVNAP